ncbi:MAG: hypothetical protein JWM13_208 [Arthrobacter sp.]|nr:hypothetical protein [Arthrobacter sp.]
MSPALAAELIRSGANVNAKDAIQDSAFLYAGAEGFNEILLLPLANGADISSTNRFAEIARLIRGGGTPDRGRRNVQTASSTLT